MEYISLLSSQKDFQNKNLFLDLDRLLHNFVSLSLSLPFYSLYITLSLFFFIFYLSLSFVSLIFPSLSLSYASFFPPVGFLFLLHPPKNPFQDFDLRAKIMLFILLCLLSWVVSSVSLISSSMWFRYSSLLLFILPFFLCFSSFFISLV